MPQKPAQVMFSYQSVAAALVRARDIHHGIWRVAFTFASTYGANPSINGRVLPAALVPVMGISLVEDEVLSDLAVDAATCWPDEPKKRKLIEAVN